MILVATDALRALIDASDRHHRRAVAALRSIREPLGTVWPVIADALQGLAAVPKGQAAVLEMIERRVLRLADLTDQDVPRIRDLLAGSSGRRLGLAGAALVRVAQRDGADTIFTVDAKPFAAIRVHGRKRLRIVPGGRP